MFRFIHIPKNGGTAAVKWFTDNSIDFVRGQYPKGYGIHRMAASYREEDLPRYCIVRDPYTRIISYYNYIAGCEGWTDFDKFIRDKSNNLIFNIPAPWRCQTDWTHYHGQQIVDKIFRYETLEQELQQHFGITASMPKENVSTKTITMEHLTPELREIVADHFRRDFENFGYKI